MKKSKLSLCFVLFSLILTQAQERKVLTLKEVIELASSQTTAAQVADAKVKTKELEFQVAKNRQLPDLKISGQYQRLSSANVNLKLKNSSSTTSASGSSQQNAKVNQLMLGNATLSYPLFAGFKIKNNVALSKHLLEAEKNVAAYTKEEVAHEAITIYLNLYKAQQSQKLIQENIKRSTQRVKDFKAMMDNGIIARNDFLKAELQVSNYKVAFEEAVSNEEILSYQLALLLKLDENSHFEIKDKEMALIEASLNEWNRKDIKAMTAQIEAAKNNVKIAKSNYYPAISLMSGYIALDLQNVLTVSNAMNFGVGVSYDVSSLFKNNKEVKVAKSKVEELELHLNQLNDQVKIEVKSAQTNLNLAKEQYKVYQEAVNQASENFRIIKDKYDNGLADTNDLLEAETQQLQAQISETYGRANIVLKYMDLQAAQGTLLSTNKN